MKLKILVAVFLTMMSFTSSAQILKSVYFVEGVPTRHQLNPAFAPRSGYIGIPGLGNFGLSVNSNVGLSTFLSPNKDGKELNTFLHKDVNSSDFLDKLNSNNVFDANVNLNIIQFGFHAGKNSFTSFDINVKSNTYTTLPKDLFSFLKTGMSNPTENYYDISDVGINTQNYIDVVLGHSRQINKKLRVGVKVKALLGVVNAYTHFDNLNISMSQDEWIISGNGELISSGLEFETKAIKNDDGTTTKHEITGADIGDVGLNGLGFAFDAGATYQLKENLELSLAVLNLGYMNWDNSVKGAMDGAPIVFDGFDDLSIDDDNDEDSGDSFGDQMDELTDDVEALFTFYEMKDVGSIKNRQSTNPTLNVGAEYSLFNDKFSVGLLSSTLFRKKFAISDVMLSANYSPAKWFDLTGHTSVSNIGWTYGGLINLSPRVFNFFVGATVVSSKLTPQYIPVNELIVNVNFGFNVLFGHKDKKKKAEEVEELILTIPTVMVEKVQKDTVVEPTTADPVAPIKQEEVKEIDSDTLSNSYYLIIGSFKSKKKAEQLHGKLNGMGFKNGVILINEVGMYRVSANSYSTHSACWDDVFKIRKKYPKFINVWGLSTKS